VHKRPIHRRRIGLRPEQRVDGVHVQEINRPFKPSQRSIAAPTPVSRLLAMLRANGIQRDVSMRLEEVSLTRYVLRGEAAPEEVSVPVVFPVEPLRIRGAEATHSGGECRLRCVNDDVEVRSREAVRLAAPLMAATDFPQVLQKLMSVFGPPEQQLIAVRTSADMM
jgi:hypothetical protein